MNLHGSKSFDTSFTYELTEYSTCRSASAGELIKLLDPKLYNRLQAPGLIHGKTTKVDVVMYVESMSTFRAQTMVMCTKLVGI